MRASWASFAGPSNSLRRAGAKTIAEEARFVPLSDAQLAEQLSKFEDASS